MGYGVMKIGKGPRRDARVDGNVSVTARRGSSLKAVVTVQSANCEPRCRVASTVAEEIVADRHG